MRRHELATVSSAHKATSILKQGFLPLNTDGTTKFQKKIEGAALNGRVLSVTDGSANSMIEDIQGVKKAQRNSPRSETT